MLDTNRNRMRACEVRRLSTAEGARRFASRVLALFGHRDMTALQFAFERGHAAIEDWLAGRKVPPDVHLILELLESTPPRTWPKRWREIRDK